MFNYINQCYTYFDFYRKTSLDGWFSTSIACRKCATTINGHLNIPGFKIQLRICSVLHSLQISFKHGNNLEETKVHKYLPQHFNIKLKWHMIFIFHLKIPNKKDVTI